jgi:hypothetical protein
MSAPDPNRAFHQAAEELERQLALSREEVQRENKRKQRRWALDAAFEAVYSFTLPLVNEHGQAAERRAVSFYDRDPHADWKFAPPEDSRWMLLVALLVKLGEQINNQGLTRDVEEACRDLESQHPDSPRCHASMQLLRMCVASDSSNSGALAQCVAKMPAAGLWGLDGFRFWLGMLQAKLLGRQGPPPVDVAVVSDMPDDTPPGSLPVDVAVVSDMPDDTPPGTTPPSRLNFDDDTCTVTLDGTAYPIDDAKAYSVYKELASARPDVLSKRALAERVKGCRGSKTIPALFNKLPPQLRNTIQRGTRGYTVRLPLRP